MKKLFGWVTGLDRGYLTLLVVAAAAAFLYVQWSKMAAERDDYRRFGELVCSAAGAELEAGTFKVKGPDGKVRTAKAARGQLCAQRIRALATYELETKSQSAEILAGALQAHNRKTEADAASARRSAEAARAAAAKMENANAAIGDDDRVGADWFNALNDVAGLRPPPGR
ncbi:MAG TPA: hypothetical protein VGD10_08100 [Allosphingosinicella sp.]|uniref:hypothetical protein n=1 Tax=Allosphingosinicella sp. TaxID=2823234 RepID=UPI002EDA9ACB